ncbi:MAG: carbamoyltransferase C-terminal domain-containing protein [Betaproteobacteria bacterium]
MKLLAIAVVAHDANAAYFDGERVRYVKFERPRQEKRFSFKSPQDWRSETEAAFGIQAAEVDHIAVTFDPSALPAEVRRHLSPDAMRRLASGQSLAETLAPEVCAYLQAPGATWLSHHYCHALSGWMLESEPVALRIVIDGLGDGRPWSVYRDGRTVAAGDIRQGSIGWGIREAGKALGIQAAHFNDIAGKVMGIQAYGRIDEGYRDYLSALDFDRLDELWSLHGWLRWKRDPTVARLTLLDWVATVHHQTAEWLLKFFASHVQADEPVAYSGGVAQNVVWNSALRSRFPNLVIAPHCSDEGLSLGALEWLRQRHALPPLAIEAFPYAQADTPAPSPSEETIDQVAQLLAQGKVVGWYQGYGEIGPRALGHRSILMDPRLYEGRARIDQIKRREPFRPYGASVLAEDFDRFFKGATDAFMLYSCEVVGPMLPAIQHVDGSCRVQRVDDGPQPFRVLLERFRTLTGCSVLLNTSLNVAGKPLAADPTHAMQLFAESPLDALCVGNTLYRR